MNSFLELVDAYRENPSSFFNIQFIVWTLVIGFIISFFVIYYKRCVIGAFIRAIRNAEANDPETAKTLEELDQENNTSAISALRKSSALQSIVTILNENNETIENEKTGTKSIKIDENTRFYIKKEAETRSRIQYGDENEPVWPLILGSLALIGIGIFTFFIGK